MKNNAAIWVGLICVFSLTGCSIKGVPDRIPPDDLMYTNTGEVNLPNEPADDKTKENLPQAIETFSEDDFVIRYQDILISDKMPFDELARQLSFDIDENYIIHSDNVNVRAGGWRGETEYTWYQIHYPSKAYTAMLIDYVVIDTEQKAWLVMVRIMNNEVSTYRGMRIGDSEQEFLERHGDSYEFCYEDSSGRLYQYSFYGDNALSYPTKVIRIGVDKRTEEIYSLVIEYSKNETMEMLDIPTLGY